jgi:tetratricopeptide (TPR) repeat protein
MEAYGKWMEDESEEARREVALLKLLGFFDRPATVDCLAALRRAPAIPGLTEPLMGLADDDWEFSLSALRDAKLLTVNREEGSGELLALDAHPLLREYFATQLRRQQPEAWRAAHRRLYERLCATTKDKPQPILEDLQPLYQAVAHGCQAGMQHEACDKVYFARILRRDENYSAFKLGALGSDLGAIACFFETPWSRVSPALTDSDQAWPLNQAGYCLRALGRLTEALEPMRAGIEGAVRLKDWNNAARYANNLSELELTLGEVAGAVGHGEESVSHADRSGDANMRMIMRTTHADALHQAGRRAEAEARFREAEQMQAHHQPDYPLLYSLQGFRYCDLLLTEAERGAWQASCSGGLRPSEVDDARRATLQAVSERAAQTLKWVEPQRNVPLLTIALDHLTLGRAALYAAILEGSSLDPCRALLQHAVDGLRRAGQQQYLPHGLLTRGWLRFLEGHRTGPESARSDLDEAWEIAERGPMKLFMADIHLHRARLFFREAKYPLGIPRRRSRRRARDHREMRLRAAQGGAGGCRAGDWRGRSLTPSLPPPS